MRVILVAALVVFVAPAFAASQPFKCALQPDGKSVRVTIANPYKQDAYCMVNCQFSTKQAGSSFQISCGKEVSAGGVETELCIKTDTRPAALVGMTGGDGDCTDPTPKDAPTLSDDDKDDEELIQRLQKQGQDFINRQKSKH